jgi:hypothetical protein
MPPLKYTPIWDNWEGGGGARSPESPTSHPRKPKPGFPGTPAIADIARDRRSKTLNHEGHPFDFPFAGSGSLRAGCETQRKTSEVYAKLGSLGTTRYKSFGILVEGWGGGLGARYRPGRLPEVPKLPKIAGIGNQKFQQRSLSFRFFRP